MRVHYNLICMMIWSHLVDNHSCKVRVWLRGLTHYFALHKQVSLCIGVHTADCTGSRQHTQFVVWCVCCLPVRQVCELQKNSKTKMYLVAFQVSPKALIFVLKSTVVLQFRFLVLQDHCNSQ